MQMREKVKEQRERINRLAAPAEGLGGASVDQDKYGSGALCCVRIGQPTGGRAAILGYILFGFVIPCVEIFFDVYMCVVD